MSYNRAIITWYNFNINFIYDLYIWVCLLLTPVLTFVFCRLVLDFFCFLLLKKVFVFLVSPVHIWQFFATFDPSNNYDIYYKFRNNCPFFQIEANRRKSKKIEENRGKSKKIAKKIEENRSKLLNYLHIFTFVIGLPQGVPIQFVNGRRRITKTEKKEEATGLTKAASSREVNP